MDGYLTMVLGLVVLVIVTLIAMLVGRASRRRLLEPDVANDTRHADSFVTEDGAVVHIDDVTNERF
jgi:membrane protein implicated in regulation of membrane protease activity